MCCSLARAHFSRTVLMLNTTRHPLRQTPIQVLAYQNISTNLSENSANAMLLHLPTAELSRDNIVDTSRFPNFLDTMVKALLPPTRDLRMRSDGLISAQAKRVEIFDHDVYTVALSQDASAIPAALQEVREDRRPLLNQEIFDWYGQRFSGWSFALCCFNNRDARKANPLLWWYEPLAKDRLMLPGLDAHTGEVPDLKKMVRVDHWVIGGLPSSHPEGKSVHLGTIPDAFTRSLLPETIWGEHEGGLRRNGDFGLTPTEGGYALDRGIFELTH